MSVVIFEGRISGASPRGDFGFVAPSSMRPADGSDVNAAELPKQPVFVHITHFVDPDVDRIRNEMPIKFWYGEGNRVGKLQAFDVMSKPRLTGTVRLPKGRTDFGFIDPERMAFEPGYYQDDVELPKEAVFIHISAVEPRRKQLVDGMRLTFYASPCLSEKKKHRLEAVCVDVIDTPAARKSAKEYGYCPVCYRAVELEPVDPEFPDDPMLEQTEFFVVAEHKDSANIHCSGSDENPSAFLIDGMDDDYNE